MWSFAAPFDPLLWVLILAATAVTSGLYLVIEAKRNQVDIRPGAKVNNPVKTSASQNSRIIARRCALILPARAIRTARHKVTSTRTDNRWMRLKTPKSRVS